MYILIFGPAHKSNGMARGRLIEVEFITDVNESGRADCQDRNLDFAIENGEILPPQPFASETFRVPSARPE